MKRHTKVLVPPRGVRPIVTHPVLPEETIRKLEEKFGPIRYGRKTAR